MSNDALVVRLRRELCAGYEPHPWAIYDYCVAPVYIGGRPQYCGLTHAEHFTAPRAPSPPEDTMSEREVCNVCGERVGSQWTEDGYKRPHEDDPRHWRLGYARIESELRDEKVLRKIADEQASACRDALEAATLARRVMREALEDVRVLCGPIAHDIIDAALATEQAGCIGPAGALSRAALAAEPGEGGPVARKPVRWGRHELTQVYHRWLPAPVGIRGAACGADGEGMFPGEPPIGAKVCDACLALPPEGRPRAAEVKNEG